MNEAHTVLAIHLRELGQIFATEVRVTPDRLWRWDFTLPEHRIAIEIDGFYKGRHQAFGKDYEKQNFGIMAGWRVLRFTTTEVLRGKAKKFLEEHLS